MACISVLTITHGQLVQQPPQLLHTIVLKSMRKQSLTLPPCSGWYPPKSTAMSSLIAVKEKSVQGGGLEPLVIGLDHLPTEDVIQMAAEELATRISLWNIIHYRQTIWWPAPSLLNIVHIQTIITHWWSLLMMLKQSKKDILYSHCLSMQLTAAIAFRCVSWYPIFNSWAVSENIFFMWDLATPSNSRAEYLSSRVQQLTAC